MQVYNKFDQVTLEELNKLAREPMTMIIRCVRVDTRDGNN